MPLALTPICGRDGSILVWTICSNQHWHYGQQPFLPFRPETDHALVAVAVAEILQVGPGRQLTVQRIPIADLATPFIVSFPLQASARQADIGIPSPALTSSSVSLMRIPANVISRFSGDVIGKICDRERQLSHQTRDRPRPLATSG